MEIETYSYRESFIITLNLCEKCGVYYSKASEPEHTCNTTSSSCAEGTPKIDIMQEISNNLTKVKPSKEKKK